MLGRSPALLPLLCLIVAVFIADTFHFPALLWWAFSILSCIAAFYLIRRNAEVSMWRFPLPGILLSIAIAAASAGYYQSAMLDRSQSGIPDEVLGRGEYRMYGEVRGWPKVSRDRTELVIDLDSIVGSRSQTATSIAVHAAVQVLIGDTTTFVQHGDQVQFSGTLRAVTPTGGRLAYHRYLERQGIQSQVYLTSIVEILRIPQAQHLWFATANVLREQLVASLHRVLPQTEASLAAGFLVGETRDLPQRTMLLFRETGTLHLLAVSGANVWLMVGFLMLLLRPVPIGRVARTLIIIALLIVFMLMCYAEPSVVRATILAILVLVGRLVGRKLDLLHLIVVAALLMLLINPWQLFSIGFQLSFLTATALVATMLPLQEWLEQRQISRWLQSMLLGVAGSVVASLISAPLVWWYFERVSVMSIPANIVIAPLVSIATLGSLAAASIYHLLPPVGVWIGTLAHLPLEWLMRIVEWFGMAGDDIRILIQDESGAMVLVFSFYIIAASFLVVDTKRRLFVSLLIALTAITSFAGISIAHQGLSAHQVIVEPIPDGTIVAITRDKWHSADLLIAGMSSRRYPIDSVIIMPMLERLGVGFIQTIAAGNIEYNAIDDVLRLAAATSASQLLIPEDERHPFQDWRGYLSSPSSVKILIQSEKAKTPFGISADKHSLEWVDSTLHVSASSSSDSSLRLSNSSEWTIQLSSHLRRSDIVLPHCDLLLCSVIEQQSSSQSRLNSSVPVIDLSKTGEVHLFLSDKLIIRSSAGETIFRKRPNAR